MEQIISKENPLSHYKWGQNCDGWNFVDKAEVNIKQECMPGDTAEKLHFHTIAEQFFFILKGTATFLVENVTISLNANTGITIKAGDKHKIMNREDGDLEFILVSYPPTLNDRTDCE